MQKSKTVPTYTPLLTILFLVVLNVVTWYVLMGFIIRYIILNFGTISLETMPWFLLFACIFGTWLSQKINRALMKEADITVAYYKERDSR